MPSNQTPQASIRQNDKMPNVSGIKPPPEQQSPQVRRKNIDRREDESSVKPEADRRSTENRRSTLTSAKAEQAKSKEQVEREAKQQKMEMRLQQHRKKKILAGCEPVMGLNYDCLAMDDYPDNSLVAAARRDRDYWLWLCCIFGSTFFLGLLDLVPAWVAGTGSGLCFMSVVFAFTSIRNSFFVRPPLSALLQKRKAIEFSALKHVAFLEGKDGLAWRCAKMAKYNTNLNRKLFQGLVHYSRERSLFQVIKNKRHIRLYLLFMIESQKAYKRVQKDYLQNHFKNLDQGWDDTISDDEAQTLKRQLDNLSPGENQTRDS